VQQAQTGIQHAHQSRGGVISAITAFSKLGLGNFEVPIGKLSPEEFIDLPAGFTELIIGEEAVCFADQGIEASPNPGIRQRPLRSSGGFGRSLGERTDDESAGIPDLVGKIAIAFHFLEAEIAIFAGGGTHQQGKAQCIRAQIFHDHQRIDHVAFGFAHLLAFFIQDQAVQIDGVERRFPGELDAEHHHAGDPEEEDIRGGLEYRGWVEVFQVRGFLGPTQCREWP